MKIVYNHFVFAAGDIGLDCNCTIYGVSEELVIYNTILHLLEYHAIRPEEMTADMKLKIENIYVHYPPPLTSPSFYNSHF